MKVIKFKYKQAKEELIMIEFYPDFKLMKNYHNRYLSKRAFIESSTTYGRWNETLYQIQFYENDILIASFE